jgi:small GTP-binding protein
MSKTENKVIFIGNSGVGKTNLIKVSVGENFDPARLTTSSVSYRERIFIFEKKKYIFNLWDTISQEQYKSITKHFLLGSQIVLFVYDISDKVSFKELNYWIELVEKELGKANESFIMGIIGNKKDLYQNMEVEEEEGKKIAELYNAKFALTSAKDDPDSINNFLDILFEDYIRKNNGQPKTRKGQKISVKNQHKNKKSRFC